MTGLALNLAFWSEKPTGLTTYARNLLPHLQVLNPTLYTPQIFPDFTCYPVAKSLSSDRGTKGHAARLLWYQTHFSRLLKQSEATLLFSPVPEAPLFIRCPFIVTVHDVIPLHFPSASPRLTTYFRSYVPFLLRRAHHIVCDSEATAKDLVSFYHLPMTKITVIPLAYDVEHFRPQGLSQSNYFLCIARHDPHKNLARVLLAFDALMDKDIELWIAGPSTAFTPNLKKLIAENGLQSRVRFLDYLPYSHLPSLLEQSLALVFPSLWEGFGLPVLEAMACGTPVITSSLSSLPEVAGDAALLIDPYSVEAITSAMTRILREPRLAPMLKQAGLIQAARFSWEKTGTSTANILKTLL
jgi:glycosyltransferase involved in cell wall biosynthesis